MTIKGTVCKQEEVVSGVQITLTNCRASRDAAWMDYQENIKFRVSEKASRAFPVGRRVRVKFTT